MNAALERMMDFDLSEEQRLVRKTVREFAEAEILPYVEEYEKDGRRIVDVTLDGKCQVFEKANYEEELYRK